ncbi:aminotransferase class I/II-fold pyridoxal phosphate-dependent enzyme [Lutispora sp.]|uniref:aminotransferase class I/II-fold pyridoxal phosphate-dependent enzyme n=1 Tax=Lutispora sp. TaxID=2828727 RepID=UPI0035645DEE
MINYYGNEITWIPELKKSNKPLYILITESLEKDIENGKLKSGFKLPPQRIIANYLGISHSTVTRAYTLCEEKGLIKGVIDKGTFVSSNADNILITSGSQNALSVILASLFTKGDRIVVDELTYTGLKSLAKLLGIILIPVKGDNSGIDIEELKNTCKRERVKGNYLIPDCHNPTTITMPMD